MEKLSHHRLNRYYLALKKGKKKFLSLHDLSELTALSETVIKNELEQYDILIGFDEQYNYLSLLPILEGELLRTVKKVVSKAPAIKKKDLEQYLSLGDFIYEHFSTNGILNKKVVLTKKELLILKKITILEIKKRN
ncbi:MAG: hypothetical protein LBR37_00040 [Erysipelotrichaceae bacterium]|jgi:hypothetical protein|nr:hypothetical protein [Erysipelotrichaceae bacterium]